MEDLVELHEAIDGSEKEAELLSADVFIQTSRSEGMSMGILEALSYGVPCLVTRGTNLGEIIEQYDAGWVAETNAEYVGRMGCQWLFFRKKAEQGRFDIFSDLDSRIKHLNKISKVLSIIALGNLVIGLANSFSTAASFAWINLLCASLLTYALGRIHGKKESLEKDRLILE